MAQIRTSRVFDLFFILALALMIFWAAMHRTAISDWFFFLSYHPDTSASQAASEAGLSDYGKRLLYRTNPQFVSRSEVESECHIELLGCMTPKGEVFISDSPGSHSQAIVTAAHEMLHLAYRRLSASQKDELAPALDEAISANAAAINPELSDETTDDDRRDEAHSLLGTEYKDLPPTLENYYSQYFSDRHKVLVEYATSLR